MDFIYNAIGKFLAWLDSAVGNYVVALFIFAVIVELLMLPFGLRQQKNSIKQASLRPKEMAIRKKYAGRNDQPTQQKMMQEIQEMYQKEGYNPMGGCLPLLIQFPIIIILYNVVINPLRYIMGVSKEAVSALVEFAGAAVDKGGLGLNVSRQNTIGLIDYIEKADKAQLSESIKAFFSASESVNGETVWAEIESAFAGYTPDFSLFGLNLGETPSLGNPSFLWVIPVLTFVVYFFSMKLTRKLTYQPTTANDPQAGCSNKIMDFSMPLMSVWISFVVPAAIGVYWIFKSILSTLKQFILSRVMPVPTFTEEDYRAAEKEMKGKAKNQPTRNYIPSGEKPRSLHYIDADDDETPAPAQKPAPKKDETPKESNSLIAQAPLKDDEKDETTEDVSSEEDAKNDNE
ncbi:MAG: membrane protein insertase YidC [Clostridia bacterium]|nr:membrane protein insertase YidC [Clostridia bacterium]